MKKLMLIINPAAGKGEYKNYLSDIIETFCTRGYCVTLFMTQKRLDAVEYAREYSGEYDMLVCCGGDGTLSEVTSGLMQADCRPALGYIPMGTANDVAASLKLSHNPKEAARNIIEKSARALDMGIFNGESYFTYVAAFGAFTDVSYNTPQERKKTVGQLAYVLAGVNSLTAIKSIHAVVEYDEGITEGNYIYGGVSNSLSIAGFVKLDESAVEFGDGLFEVMLINMPTSIMELRNICHSIINKRYSTEYIHFLHTSRVRFTFDEPVPWTRDGEDGGKHVVVEAVNSCGAIDMIY